MKKLKFLFCAILLFACKSNQDKTNVLVLSTIHGAHAKNPNYSYNHLFRVIKDYDPDVIGIEIRSEDMNQAADYLENFYPLEMRMVKDSFPNITEGIDFYGNEVRGKLIPADAFTDAKTELGNYVQLEMKLSGDSVFSTKKKEVGLVAMQQEQIKMAMEDAPEDFMSGKYDSITLQYYKVLESLLYGTEYQSISDFNTARDAKITRNAVQLVKTNRSKKILILVGANHRGRLIGALQRKKGLNVLSSISSK